MKINSRFSGMRNHLELNSTLEYELVPPIPSNLSVSAYQLNPWLTLICLLFHLCASCSSSRLFLLHLACSMRFFPECWRLPVYSCSTPFSLPPCWGLVAFFAFSLCGIFPTVMLRICWLHPSMDGGGEQVKEMGGSCTPFCSLACLAWRRTGKTPLCHTDTGSGFPWLGDPTVKSCYS